MTKIYFLLLACFTALQACAQTPSLPTTMPTEPPKPAGYASAKEGWLVDLDEAYEISVRDKKPILANFTGSDWCGWCKKLDADVFSKPEFQEWAKKNVVLLEVDFPRRFQIPQKNQQQNGALQQALGITGYPTIWLMNITKDATTGKYNLNPLGKTGYTPSPDQFIATMNGFMKQG